MIKFSKEKVLLLHKLIAAETGGAVGVRDMGLLESALEGVFATYDGQELYIPPKRRRVRDWASPSFQIMHLWMATSELVCM